MQRAGRRLERGLKDATAEAVQNGAEIKKLTRRLTAAEAALNEATEKASKAEGAEIKKLRRRLTAAEAALNEATEEASKAEAEAGATKEKLAEEKLKTKEFRDMNKDLKERLHESQGLFTRLMTRYDISTSLTP